MSQWSIEVASWPRLTNARRREFLRLAGDAGGEWWGAGRIHVGAYPNANRLSTSARKRGFHVRVKPLV
jgi:hypothetical protein